MPTTPEVTVQVQYLAKKFSVGADADSRKVVLLMRDIVDANDRPVEGALALKISPEMISSVVAALEEMREEVLKKFKPRPH